MKRKLAVFFLSAAIACCGAAVISSCGWPSDDASNSGWSVQTAYAQAVDLGFEGTLEEFLALIEGEDGSAPPRFRSSFSVGSSVATCARIRRSAATPPVYAKHTPRCQNKILWVFQR